MLRGAPPPPPRRFHAPSPPTPSPDVRAPGSRAPDPGAGTSHRHPGPPPWPFGEPALAAPGSPPSAPPSPDASRAPEASARHPPPPDPATPAPPAPPDPGPSATSPGCRLPDPPMDHINPVGAQGNRLLNRGEPVPPFFGRHRPRAPLGAPRRRRLTRPQLLRQQTQGDSLRRHRQRRMPDPANRAILRCAKQAYPLGRRMRRVMPRTGLRHRKHASSTRHPAPGPLLVRRPHARGLDRRVRPHPTGPGRRRPLLTRRSHRSLRLGGTRRPAPHAPLSESGVLDSDARNCCCAPPVTSNKAQQNMPPLQTGLTALSKICRRVLNGSPYR